MSKVDHQRDNSFFRPFKWGYINAWFITLIAALLSGFATYDYILDDFRSFSEELETLLFFYNRIFELLLYYALLALGIGMIKRRKIAWSLWLLLVAALILIILLANLERLFSDSEFELIFIIELILLLAYFIPTFRYIKKRWHELADLSWRKPKR